VVLRARTRAGDARHERVDGIVQTEDSAGSPDTGGAPGVLRRQGVEPPEPVARPEGAPASAARRLGPSAVRASAPHLPHQAAPTVSEAAAGSPATEEPEPVAAVTKRCASGRHIAQAP